MRLSGFQIHPVLLLCLMVVWGAASMYLFATGIGELIQINHEMTELLTKGNTALPSEQTAPAQIHVGWKLVAGTVGLGMALALFHHHHRRRGF